MEKEMRKSAPIDEAFKSIKTATGVTDVQEMVRKFLTREQTYSQLLMAVSDSERKIDKLKKDNEELRNRLHELSIDTDSSSQQAPTTQPSSRGGGAPTNSAMDEEIIEMNNTLQNQQKEIDLLQERFKRINIVNDQVTGWAKRVFHKFHSLVDSSMYEKKEEDKDIVMVFEGMSTMVVNQLEAFKAQEDRGGDIEYGEVFNDFATDDFISKNIRVRPVSGYT